MVRHGARFLLTVAVLRLLRRTPQETVSELKPRWQLAGLRHGEPPPIPLRTCLPGLRATA